MLGAPGQLWSGQPVASHLVSHGKLKNKNGLPWFHLTSVDPPVVKKQRVIITNKKPSSRMEEVILRQ